MPLVPGLVAARSRPGKMLGLMDEGETLASGLDAAASRCSTQSALSAAASERDAAARKNTSASASWLLAALVRPNSRFA